MLPYANLPHNLPEGQPAQAGVFVVRNCHDARLYVGAARHLRRAYQQTRKALRTGQHHARGLQALATAHGLDCLRFEVVEVCPVGELASAKQRHVAALHATDPAHGFNTLATAGFTQGQPLSAAHRARISTGKRGRPITPRTPEHQAKLAAAHRGRTRSPETRAAISAATRGKPKRQRPHT